MRSTGSSVATRSCVDCTGSYVVTLPVWSTDSSPKNFNPEKKTIKKLEIEELSSKAFVWDTFQVSTCFTREKNAQA